jgi:small-conductance mechanosensitive channel
LDLVNLLGDLVKWFFIIVFLLQALSIAHLQRVTDLVQHVLGYVPNVLAAAALLFVGFVVADLTGRLVLNTARAIGANTARLLSDGSRYTIMAVVSFTALAQLGVNTVFLERLFTAIVAMLALAGGLAFGLGGRDTAKDVLDRVRGSFERDREL